ncbi:MAG: SDR family oxidoreductase [Planctomycetota bacterium]|nr:SDR family oxidoreductase [Planctomycetota bacterium]
MQIEGARVLVTGGSRGIGKATAKRLIDAGARVMICGRNGKVVEQAAQELGCSGMRADVSDADDVEALVAGTIRELGGLDALVNNAAIGTFATLVDTDVADMGRVWRINVLGALLAAQASARHFISQKSGTILNVGSTAARKGFAGGSVYASSKFALSGLTECWRTELRQHGIRVMQINPSEVQTEFGSGMQPKANPTKLQSDDIAQAIVDMLALPDRGFITETSVWATNPQ